MKQMMEMNALNDLDRGYQYLLECIMQKGQERETRAGKVKSIFGKHFRIDLKKGFPLLTTKKVFAKGVLHELLWFLQRPFNNHMSMNIEYLVRNDVHIWDDDAFRWFKEWVTKEILETNREYYFVVAIGDDEMHEEVHFEWWIENELRKGDIHWLLNLSKEEFLDLVLQRVEIWVKTSETNDRHYRFGDLGPVYGTQWRHFGSKTYKGVDQIKNIIDTLKSNPTDRRMLCVAWNPQDLKDVALPPCHVMMQFYTRKLSNTERWELYKKKIGDTEEYNKATNPWERKQVKAELNKKLDENRIPVYGLSCMWTQRSVDTCLGLPFNIASYAFLTNMIAKIVNMEPDELIGSLGDCHIYENQFEGVKEQLERKGNENLPTLKINGFQHTIEDFNFDDFEIIGYNPDPPIKFPLSVG